MSTIQTLNEVRVTGRVATEVQYQERGTGPDSSPYKFARLRLSITDDRGGQSFVTARSFGPVAEAWQAEIRRGQQIEIIGSLRTDEWTAQDGSNRSETFISTTQVLIHGHGNEAQSTEGAVVDLTKAREESAAVAVAHQELVPA